MAARAPSAAAAALLLLSAAVAAPRTAAQQHRGGGDVLLDGSPRAHAPAQSSMPARRLQQPSDPTIQLQLPTPNVPAQTANGGGGGGCTDTPGWTDKYNDTCSYYSSPAICTAEGGADSDGGMGTASDHCCACGKRENGAGAASQTAPGQPQTQPAQPAQPVPVTPPTPAVSVPAQPTPAQPAPTATNNGETTVATACTPGAAGCTDDGQLGTCGKKDRGNGVCADGTCCSKFGHCGTTPAHCDGTTLPPTAPPSDAPTTPAPTSKYAAVTPGHRKFCGPKVVGGFAVAQDACSKEMECGFETAATAFGSTGNDCPKGLMCYDGIVCEPPTVSPTEAPTYRPTVSGAPTEEGQTRPPTASPVRMPTYEPTTETPTYQPTRYAAPTVPPANVVNSITARGSYCGQSFQAAVNKCRPERRCATNDDCERGTCWPGVSCTFEAGASELFRGDEDDDEGPGAEPEFGEEYDPNGGAVGALGAGAVAAALALAGAGAWLV
ncbi:hypothetical protein ACHAXT_012851 [Thalassiosira profunda]